MAHIGVKSAFLLGAICLALGASPAAAKGREFLGGFRDWDAFVERRDKGEKNCYMISVPKETAPKSVKRGEIYIIITHWPQAKIRNQVNVVVGYPFKKDSVATARIDKRSFRLFTDGDRAWAYDDKQDQEMTAAMKKGSKIVVEGESARGTKTSDRYSLNGFSAALNAITKACY